MPPLKPKNLGTKYRMCRASACKHFPGSEDDQIAEVVHFPVSEHSNQNAPRVTFFPLPVASLPSDCQEATDQQSPETLSSDLWPPEYRCCGPLERLFFDRAQSGRCGGPSEHIPYSPAPIGL